APVPAQYKEAPAAPVDAYGARWQSAQPADEAPTGAWWRVFQAPELDALMAQLHEHTPSIAQAEAQYRAAQALLQQAQAKLFPTLDARLDAQRTGSAGQRAEQYSAALAASWAPDLWGGVRRSIEANDAEAQARYARLAGVRLSAEAQLATAWLQWVIATQQLAQMRQSEAALAEAWQLTQHQYRAGIVTDGVVAQAESQLKSQQARRIECQLARAQLEHAIAAALGFAPIELELPATFTLPVLPNLPAGLPSDLLQRRPDIAAAERDMAAANARIGVARAALFPSLTLDASLGRRASVLDELFRAPNRFWALGADMLLSLFDGGQRRAHEAQMQAEYDAAVAAWRQTVLNALREVEDLLAARRLLAQQAETQRAAVQAARRAENIASNQYRSGTVSHLEVLTTQSNRLAAENSLWDIYSRQYSTAVALIAALGGGWQMPDTLPDEPVRP
ncbi:MAG: efflux transporter outer membrane subunit, partial [Ottowia sp.]|nr:efflux transporter outer membrane subunit [Ottowia sp.]